MTTMNYLVPRNEPPQSIQSDDPYLTLEPLINQTDVAAPGLPGFCVLFYPHAEGRVFVLKNGRQTVASGAAASTPRAARELWEVLFKLRQARLPETKPAGAQHPGLNVWAEMVLMDFTGLSLHESGLAGRLAANLVGALVRRQLELQGRSAAGN